MTVPSLTDLLDTWQRWSYHDLLTQAHTTALATGDTTGADHLRRTLALEPPADPLEALAANHKVASLLLGWQWHVVRAAREAGVSWDRIGDALGMPADQARAGYLDAIERAERHVPDLTDTARYRAVLDDPLPGAAVPETAARRPTAGGR